MKKYKTYNNITKELLDTITVGCKVKCNKWRAPLIVSAVSENYFVMYKILKKTPKHTNGVEYSICKKTPSEYQDWRVRKGRYEITLDDRMFCQYDYSNPVDAKRALDDIENGELGLSVRNRRELLTISILD